MLRRILLLLSAVCLLAGDSTALLINGYNRDRHERFANNVRFVGSPHDWSGIGRNDVFATMVSDTFFLTASHKSPTPGRTITFFHDNKADGTTEVREVEKVWKIGTSDLKLGRFKERPSDAVARYLIAGLEGSALRGQQLFLFGAGGLGPQRAQQRLGTNQVNQFVPGFRSAALGGPADIFIYDFNKKAGPNEASVESGDSGAPVFLRTNGGPLLVGIHWFQFTADDKVTVGTGDTFIPSYIEDVNSIMAEFNEQLTVARVRVRPDSSDRNSQ